MQTKHTPGPFSAAERFVITPNRTAIAEVYQTPGRPSAAEAAANAVLFAAAPDLLKACEAALSALQLADQALLGVSGIDAQKTLRNAIAKAEGRR